jgi:hypothetical protein
MPATGDLIRYPVEVPGAVGIEVAERGELADLPRNADEEAAAEVEAAQSLEAVDRWWKGHDLKGLFIGKQLERGELRPPVGGGLFDELHEVSPRVTGRVLELNMELHLLAGTPHTPNAGTSRRVPPGRLVFDRSRSL